MRWRITVQGEGIELRGWVDLEVLAAEDGDRPFADWCRDLVTGAARLAFIEEMARMSEGEM